MRPSGVKEINLSLLSSSPSGRGTRIKDLAGPSRMAGKTGTCSTNQGMDVNKGGDCSFGQEEVGGTCANIRVHSTKIPDQIFNQSQTNSPEIISFMMLMTMGRPLTMAEPLLPALLTCGFSQIVFSGQSGGVGEREGQEGVSEFKGGHLSLIVTCHC